MASTLILLTIGLPWLGALLVWWIGDERPEAQNRIAVGFAVAAGVVALLLLPQASPDVVVRWPVGGIFGDFTFAADGLGVFLAVVATVIGSLAVLFSVDYMRGEAQLGRYYALVLMFIGAMAGLVLTTSLLLLFLFWEMVAFCSYALISFYNDDPKAVAGGIKALVITQLGGVGLLFGALVSYAYLGSYELSALLEGAGQLPGHVLAWVAYGFLIGAAAKSAQVPFHTWLPDAMEAPTPVSALIHAATMVNAGVYLLARFYPAFADVPSWREAVVTVGALSALLAAVMAVVSTDIKRVLAYSTISQLGYMVYAVGAGAVFASQFHLLSHAVFKALLFLGAGAVIHAVGTRDIRQMGALGRQMPFVRTVFVIGAGALAGIPILNGFWSKELILEGGRESGMPLAYLAMLLGVAITALYTFRVVWLTFYGEARSELHGHDAPMAMRVSLSVLALGTVVSWLLAGPFGHLLEETLPHHHLHILTTGGLIVKVLADPMTWLVLLITAIGLAAWQWRERLTAVSRGLQWLVPVAEESFGFEPINRGAVRLTRWTADVVRTTQTGQLSWNVVGILLGVIVVLTILSRGA
ncbi:MAG: hypothetical protein Kow0047_01980 [Anaerolineae bacterium]